MRPSRSLPCLAAGRILARRQAERGGELPAAGESARLPHGGDDRLRGDRADTGNRHQAPRGIVSLDQCLDLFVDRHDLGVDRIDLMNQRRQRSAHAIGHDDFAVVIAAVSKEALERIGVLRALRRHDADLAHGRVAR